MDRDLSLEASTADVLMKDIPWDTYMAAKLITPTDFQLLRRYDKRPKELQTGLLEESCPAYVKTFLTVLRNVYKEETTEYVLALLLDLLAGGRNRAAMFFAGSLSAPEVFEPFTRLLSSKNWYILEATTRILALLLVEYQSEATRPSSRRSLPTSASLPPSSSVSSAALTNGHANGLSTPTTLLESFIPWLCQQLSSPAHPTRGVQNAVSALAAVLRLSVARPMFVESGGVPLLLPLVKPVSSQQQMQTLYEAVLCVWLLSFNEEAVEALRGTKAVEQLNEVARSSTKEKVVRVAVMALNNLMLRGNMGAAMVELGLPKTVQSLKLQTWHDEDLKEALVSLEEGLRHNLRVLSSFDKYRQEVLSGGLDWTPMHKDPAFWRENAAHFEDNEFQILKALIALLASSRDKVVLAVACHDLAQFINAHPSGRNIAHDLRAKEKVLGLMGDDDPGVRKEALLCVQKLLLSAKYVSYLQA